jgi:hypothetical protein
MRTGLGRLAGAVTVLLAIVCLTGAEAGRTVDVSFARGRWEKRDWLMAGSPRWSDRGRFLQEADHIRNAVPPDATEAEMLASRAGETYASMIWREPFAGDAAFRLEASFDQRMAPLLVLADEIDRDAEGFPRYGRHVEIVLFDKGVNLWFHDLDENGAPTWEKIGYARFDLAAGVRHVLEVHREGELLVVWVGKHEFAVREPRLGETIYAGLTGCEGVNRFYRFTAAD